MENNIFVASTCSFLLTVQWCWVWKSQWFQPKTFTKAYTSDVISDLLAKGQTCPTSSETDLCKNFEVKEGLILKRTSSGEYVINKIHYHVIVACTWVRSNIERSFCLYLFVARAGGPGFDPGSYPALLSSSWYSNIDGMKDLWCSSMVCMPGLTITFSSCTVKVSAHAYIYPDMFKFCPDIGLHKTIMNIGNHTAVNVYSGNAFLT